jgi:hypothetical protein
MEPFVELSRTRVDLFRAREEVGRGRRDGRNLGLLDADLLHPVANIHAQPRDVLCLKGSAVHDHVA